YEFARLPRGSARSRCPGGALARLPRNGAEDTPERDGPPALRPWRRGAGPDRGGLAARGRGPQRVPGRPRSWYTAANVSDYAGRCGSCAAYTRVHEDPTRGRVGECALEVYPPPIKAT